MSYNYSGNYVYNYRRNSFTDKFETLEPKTHLQKGMLGHEIKYHQPFERLAKRNLFNQTLNKYIKDDNLLKLDNFALFDAVAKRGGFMQVCSKNKWQQIIGSLIYEKWIRGSQMYYQQHLRVFEAQLMYQLKYTQNNTISESEFYQFHLLTTNNLTTHYYDITPSQYKFAQTNFFSFDEYFNIKTLALLQQQINKIPVQYAEKFMMARKWLLFSNQITNTTPKELRSLYIPQSTNLAKVVIIGMSLTSLLIADKLSSFGIPVIIFDKNMPQNGYKDDNYLVQNGLILLQGGKQIGSYLHNLKNNKITLEELNIREMAFLDQQGKPYSQQKIRLSEQHFMSLIDEMKGQIMSKKNVYQQIISRLMRKKLEGERTLIKWHYERYMMFNRIKGDYTTVGDLCVYQSKKNVKHIAHGYNLVTIKSIDSLLTKIKQNKNVKFIRSSIDSISHNKVWNISFRGETLSSTHLIYSDQELIYRSVLEGVPKIPQLSSDLMGDTLTIIQQLTVMKYVNCLYKFREMIVLKQHLKNQNYFSICSARGFIYFFIISPTDILAIMNCFHNHSINYYTQILNILQNKCMTKNNRLFNSQQIFSYQYTFGIKDQNFVQAIINIKKLERMFMMLPITTTNCPHRTAAQIDMASFICAHILDETYPGFMFDQTIKNEFKQGNSIAQLTPQKTQSKDIKQVKEERFHIIKSNSEIEKNRREKEINQTSIPIQLKKPIFIEQKVKFISVIPNNNADVVPLIQEDIPTVYNLYQLNDDWFGIKHPIVKGYQSFVKNKIESSPKAKQGLLSIGFFQISQPMMIYPTVWLHSLGQPYIKQVQWFSCLLSKPKEQVEDYIFLLNKMITRREYLSLEDTFKTTIYYQTILVIDDIVYYVLIDENRPNIRYFHHDLNVLVSKFNDRLNKSRLEHLEETPLSKRHYGSLVTTRCKRSTYPPGCLVSSIIEEQVRRQLLEKGDLSLQIYLQQKLSQRLDFFVNKYMCSESKLQQIIQEIPYNKQDILYNQLSTFLSIMCRINELKDFSLFQIFFGFLDEQYIGCQIMKKFTQNPLTYASLQKLDEPLGKQIQEIFSKNIKNQMYSLMISPEGHSMFFHRNFMHSSKKYHFQRYTYLKSFQFNKNQTNSKHYLLQNQRKVQFSNLGEIIKQILRQLLLEHNEYEIISQFQMLIYREIQLESNLSPRVKLYYKMTRKCISPNVTIDSISKLNQKQIKSIYNDEIKQIEVGQQ